MKRIFTLTFFVFSLAGFSQEDAWVYFADKPDAATALANPLTILTQRSLDRRAAQNISLDEMDVPVSTSYIVQVEAANGVTVMAKSKWLNALHVRGTQAAINALLSLSFVNAIVYADPSLNPGGRPAGQHQTGPKKKVMQPAVIYDYGDSANQIEMLNGQVLHQQDYIGTGKIIAVMDGGFPGVDSASPFQNLVTNGHILGGFDFVNRDTNFYTGISHGSLVLSTMGGYTPGQLVGTAPGASYYLYITEDGNNENPLEESLWVEAAEEADRVGADVITTSLGYSNFDNTNYSHTYADMNGTTTFISRGLNVAFSRGMICVVSAGNEGNNDWHYITAPADATYALAVGAVNASGNYATFSSQGPSSDGRVKPDVAAQGQNSVLSNPQGEITTASGTSFSGPIIAGMVASFWQALPEKTNSEIVQLIKESSSRYNNPDSEVGYGIPDFGLALETALGLPHYTAANCTVYPNPAADRITVAMPKGLKATELYLYNTLGQLVMQRHISPAQNVIPVDALEAGVYIYNLEGNGISQNGKLIRQ